MNTDVARAILAVGQFVPNDNETQWTRKVGDTVVVAHVQADRLTLSLSPHITADAHHEGRRDAAGVYFEIAARYAEKVDGTVQQRATIVACGQEPIRTIARYPERPLTFDQCCPGFQRTFLRTGDDLPPVPPADDELYQTW
jgi:hypothetical protein